MDLLQKTQEICQKNNIKPARSKGQNFLIDENVYDRIVAAAEIDKNDVVLEVGPGLGFLTEKLAEKAERVVAVELDDGLYKFLLEKFKQENISNVDFLHEDVLKISNFQFPISNVNKIGNWKLEIGNYKIVANLPYNITSFFLRKFLESENKPKTMTLMLQKEVAERIVAKPGKMSLLAVSVQFYADAEIVEYVPKAAFWPVPEVDSAVIKLEVRPPAGGRTSGGFFRLVKFGFSSRRKMLKNNLAGGYGISQNEAGGLIKKAGFDEKIRAQELSVDNWAKLFGFFE